MEFCNVSVVKKFFRKSEAVKDRLEVRMPVKRSEFPDVFFRNGYRESGVKALNLNRCPSFQYLCYNNYIKLGDE